VNETPGSSPRPFLVELGGEIDLRNAQALDDALCEAIDRKRAELLVDLSTVPFIDSSGLRMMVRVHQHAVARNCGVRWRGMQPAPARVAAAAGLDHVLHFENPFPTSSDEAHAGRGISTLDGADRAAEQRDLTAAARDEAAVRRDADAAAQIARNRISTAADRAASALDRKEAARARHGASHQLRNACRDDLTGVLSRDAGRDQLGHALDRAHRTGEPLVIAFVDVDHLKRVNDAYGHAHGDGLL
jgi:anti-anti-sigma factor